MAQKGEGGRGGTVKTVERGLQNRDGKRNGGEFGFGNKKRQDHSIRLPVKAFLRGERKQTASSGAENTKGEAEGKWGEETGREKPLPERGSRSEKKGRKNSRRGNKVSPRGPKSSAKLMGEKTGLREERGGSKKKTQKVGLAQKGKIKMVWRSKREGKKIGAKRRGKVTREVGKQNRECRYGGKGGGREPGGGNSYKVDCKGTQKKTL